MNMTLVIKFVGMVLTLCVVGIVTLAYRGSAIPDVLQNIAVGSLALLGGLLAQPRTPTPTE